mgnify:CR=1 FL=1
MNISKRCMHMNRFLDLSTRFLATPSVVMGGVTALAAQAWPQIAVAGFDVVELENPLAFETIPDLLVAILNVIIVIAVPIIVFFIIYAGFLYVTAQGNAEQVRTATRALTYAIIGGVLILGAVAIAEIIGNIVADFEKA